MDTHSIDYKIKSLESSGINSQTKIKILTENEDIPLKTLVYILENDEFKEVKLDARDYFNKSLKDFDDKGLLRELETVSNRRLATLAIKSLNKGLNNSIRRVINARTKESKDIIKVRKEIVANNGVFGNNKFSKGLLVCTGKTAKYYGHAI